MAGRRRRRRARKCAGRSPSSCKATKKCAWISKTKTCRASKKRKKSK